MKHYWLVYLMVSCCLLVAAQRKTENVVLITLDGFRWEELFGGGVDTLMNDLAFVKDTAKLQKAFAGVTKQERREKLMPWFWANIGTAGQIYGNRWYGNNVNCTNIHWFSYPGYNEILTGYSDPYVNSNDKKYNKNVTVLEWLHQQEAYNGKVAAFCSWDVFPFIINDVRSGIPVNASASFNAKELTEKEQLLNDLQDEVPVLFGDMRLDLFTHHYALEYMQKYHPLVVYIGYGETDDFAHAGKYDNYLNSAHQTDKWIGEVWDFLQSDDQYRDKTTMLITTDHGRGSSPKEEWKSHGKIFKGSPGIWFAVMGPDTPATGEVTQTGQLYQNQVAETLARFLGLDFISPVETGECIYSMFSDQAVNDKR